MKVDSNDKIKCVILYTENCNTQFVFPSTFHTISTFETHTTGAASLTAGGFCMPRTMKEYSEQAKQFYKSQAWAKCRASYIASVGGLCERCLAKGLIVPGYIVHHKCYINSDNINDPSVTLNFDNLEYLCAYHHNAEHFKGKYDKRYSIDENGKVIADEHMDSI